MPVVHTTQNLTKAPGERILSSPKRVPLRALQMLTQSVSPLTREYVQPFPISEGSEQQKKSPLALLAATCSSIGKTEAKQDVREALSARQSPKSSLNNTPSSDGRSSIKKISNDESKSSFKPYNKHDEKEPNQNSSATVDKPGFRAPSKDCGSGDSLNTHQKSPEFRSKTGHVGTFTPFQYPYLSDPTNAHCFYQTQNRMCGMYFDMAHSTTGHHPCLKGDCSGNCGSVLLPPTSLGAPTTPSAPSIRPLFPSPPVSASSSVKSHGLPTSAGRSNPLYPRCNCGYCTQAAPSQDGSSSAKGIQHPGLPHYHRDYLQTTGSCQDPYCTNCKSQLLSPNTSGSSSRGCGPHCFHHHHENATVLPGSLSNLSSITSAAMSHLYPYGFMLRSQTDQANPFVCNWVQDSKNCGKNFATSDELLQHLRTHTSAASVTASSHTPCNIPGCPCSLKSPLSGPSRLHSARYHPYFLPSPSAMHSSSFHSAITPYASPHGIPYGSSFKPY